MINEHDLKQKLDAFDAVFKVVVKDCSPSWTISEIIVNTLSNLEDRYYERETELLGLVAAKAPVHASLPGFKAAVDASLEDLTMKGILVKSKAVIIDPDIGQRNSYTLSDTFMNYVVLTKTYLGQHPHFIITK